MSGPTARLYIAVTFALQSRRPCAFVERLHGHLSVLVGNARIRSLSVLR